MAKSDTQKNTNIDEGYDEGYDFETATTTSINTPSIRIGLKSIVFNSTFKKMLGDSETTKIKLGYNSKNKTIRIRIVDGNEKGGILIDKTKIPSAGFLQHYKLEQYASEKGNWVEAIFDEKEQAFYVKLD